MHNQTQADTVIYDNLTAAGGNAIFGGGTGFPQSRNLVGEDISTAPLTNPGQSYVVNEISFNFLVFGTDGNASTTYNDIDVEVTFLENVTGVGGAAIASSFATANVLGSQTISLGSRTTLAGSSTTANGFLEVLDFSGSGGINIGDGQDIGIVFEFSDSTLGSENGALAIAYRNDSAATNVATIGSTSSTNFRDADGSGFINTGDQFGFGSEARLRFSVSATAVPEPTSAVALGLLGMGLVARRRR